MSSANKTSLGLNLWDESDKPQMADFNSDNALIDALLQKETPIGSSFEWSPVDGAPDLTTAQKVHDFKGFGTWALLGIGRVTVCIDANDPNFDTAGKIYGEPTHSLTADENGQHVHPEIAAGGGGSPSENWIQLMQGGTTGMGGIGVTGLSTGSSGSGTPHNNIQPSVAVYRWQRIA